MKILNFDISRNGITWGGKNKYYKSNPINGVPYLNLNQTEILSPESWNAYDIYSTTSMLKEVIDKRGDFLSTGQWQHVVIKGDKEEIVKDSEYVKLLEHPNPLQEGNDYIKLWNEMRCVFGNTYEYQVKPIGFNEPSMLNLLPPADMEVEVTGKWYTQTKLEDIVRKFTYCQETIEKEDINYTWIPNSKNPLIGESPLNAIFMEISNVRASNKFLNTIMAKKGALGILSSAGNDGNGGVPLVDKERQRLEAKYGNDYGIEDDQLQTILTNASLSYTPMAYPTTSLGIFETLEQAMQVFCGTFGMHRHLFPTVTGATFDNQSEAEKQTYNNTIIPLGEELAMNRTKLFGMDGNKEFMRLSFDHVPSMQEDNKEKAEVAKLNAQAVTTMRKEGYKDEQITRVTGIEL